MRNNYVLGFDASYNSGLTVIQIVAAVVKFVRCDSNISDAHNYEDLDDDHMVSIMIPSWVGPGI